MRIKYEEDSWKATTGLLTPIQYAAYLGTYEVDSMNNRSVGKFSMLLIDALLQYLDENTI